MSKSADREEKPGYGQRVPAVEQAVRILFALAESARSPLPLTEICVRVGIHKSKGYSLLNTLMEFALVARDPAAKTYSLGPGLLSLSRAVLDHTDLRGVAAPFLSRLVAETRSTALLGLRNGDRVLVVAKEEPSEGIGVTIRIGHGYPLTWGAHGKALVAFLPEPERDRVLTEERLFFWGETEGSAAERAGVGKELEEARRTGFAKDLGRVQAGIHAVAAPLFGAGAEPIGAVILVGTFARANAADFGRKTAACAKEISSLLGSTLERVYRKGG